MAETVFTGKEIEELALIDASASLALGQTDVTKLPNDFFVRDGHATDAIGRAMINKNRTCKEIPIGHLSLRIETHHSTGVSAEHHQELISKEQ
jgi:hypothetical protein